MRRLMKAMREAFPEEVLKGLETPVYIVDKRRLRKNAALIRDFASSCGIRVLLAQKAFSMYALYPLLAEYLQGCTASSLYEARLAHDYMPGRENHIFSPAYRPEEWPEIVDYCDHIVLNSPAQWKRFAASAKERKPDVSLGLRLNPEHQTQRTTPLYDPCAPFSRLGTTLESYRESFGTGPSERPRELEGFHMHTLCEQNSDALEETVEALERQFGAVLYGLRWLNLGGGHHLSREDYDLDRLYRILTRLKQRYGCEIYLEPGEAVAYHAGYLVTRVLDVMQNGKAIAILDSSAECHMPDVLAMPYRPPLLHAGELGEKAVSYRLSSATCLAGDVIGDYSFDHPLRPGDPLVFEDMAIYTMVKNNTFNGLRLPSIATYDEGEGLRILKRFGYEDFRSRL